MTRPRPLIVVAVLIGLALAGCTSPPSPNKDAPTSDPGQGSENAVTGPLLPGDRLGERIGPLLIFYEPDHPGTTFLDVQIPSDVDLMVVDSWVESRDSGPYWIRSLTDPPLNPLGHNSVNGIYGPDGRVAWSYGLPDAAGIAEDEDEVIEGPHQGRINDPEAGTWRLFISANGGNARAVFRIDVFYNQTGALSEDGHEKAVDQTHGPYAHAPPGIDDAASTWPRGTFEVPEGAESLTIIVNGSIVSAGPYWMSGTVDPEFPGATYGLYLYFRASVDETFRRTGIALSTAGDAAGPGELFESVQRKIEVPTPGPWDYTVRARGENVAFEVTFEISMEKADA